MRHAAFICLLVVIFGFFELAKSSFFPYMTCPGCETFVSCFFKCPRKIYPGINRYAIIYRVSQQVWDTAKSNVRSSEKFYWVLL